eukprot:Nk52_evm1s2574 gene=Nk52_evmTU1s2574
MYSRILKYSYSSSGSCSSARAGLLKNAVVSSKYCGLYSNMKSRELQYGSRGLASLCARAVTASTSSSSVGSSLGLINTDYKNSRGGSKSHLDFVPRIGFYRTMKQRKRGGRQQANMKDVLRANPTLVDEQITRKDARGEEYLNEVTSLGVLIEPYIPPLKFRPFLSRKGLADRYKYVISRLKSTMAMATVKRSEPNGGLNAVEFAADIESLYNLVHSKFAKGDFREIESYCTPAVYESMKKAARENGHNSGMSWEVVETVNRPKIEQASVAPMDQAKKLFIAQVVVSIDQMQSFNKGAGKTAPLHVQEYVVVERPLYKSNDWRICGKIQRPEYADDE